MRLPHNPLKPKGLAREHSLPGPDRSVPNSCGFVGAAQILLKLVPRKYILDDDLDQYHPLVLGQPYRKSFKIPLLMCILRCLYRHNNKRQISGVGIKY
jgi:hypothetical protein